MNKKAYTIPTTKVIVVEAEKMFASSPDSNETQYLSRGTRINRSLTDDWGN